MENKKSNFYTLAPLFITILIDSMGVSIIYPILAPLFSAKIGGMLSMAAPFWERDFLYGLVIGIFPLFMFFGAPILGDISDYIGRKKVLLLCLYGEGIGFLLCGLAITINSVLLLVISRAFAGLMAGSVSLAQAAIADVSDESNKSINFGLIAVANSVGFVLGPMLSGFLANQNIASWFSYETPFFAAAILAAFNGTLLIFTFKETFYTTLKKKIDLLKGVTFFISAFINRNIRILAIIYLLMQCGWALFFQFVNLYLVQIHNYTVMQVGYYVIWVATTFGFSYLVIVRIFARFFKPHKIICYGLCLTVIGILIAVQKEVWAQWLGVVPLAIGVALAFANLLTLFSNSVDEYSQGWVMGVAASITAISWGMSSIFAGILAAISLKIPFMVITLLLLSSAILAFLYLWNFYRKTKL